MNLVLIYLRSVSIARIFGIIQNTKEVNLIAIVAIPLRSMIELVCIHRG